MFCWIELATTDQAAAKKFYSSLFGWTTEDSAMGEGGGSYTMFRLNGKQVGGGYTLMPDQVAMHVPPNWLVYVAVESADTTTDKAKQLGAKIYAGPMDVADYGRMSIIADPTGAVFGIWQAKQHAGTEIVGADGTFSWADLKTSDPKRAGEFYSALFGWKLEKGEDDPEGSYLHIKNGEHYIGGVPSAEHLQPGTPPHWSVYFHTSDCDALSNKAKSLGANVCFGPVTLENVGRFSIAADPQGAYFSMFQPMRKA
jgi:predicted enzyme related to lactoylglutathione lyase